MMWEHTNTFSTKDWLMHRYLLNGTSHRLIHVKGSDLLSSNIDRGARMGLGVRLLFHLINWSWLTTTDVPLNC